MRAKHLTKKEGEELNISQFPNFHKSGSIKGMKKQFYGKDALLIRCGDYIYYVGNLAKNTESPMPYGENLYFNYAK